MLLCWNSPKGHVPPPRIPNTVITPGYIEDLDDEGKLIGEGYLSYRVIDKECDKMGEMCDPYEGL